MPPYKIGLEVLSLCGMCSQFTSKTNNNSWLEYACMNTVGGSNFRDLLYAHWPQCFPPAVSFSPCVENIPPDGLLVVNFCSYHGCQFSSVAPVPSCQ